MYRSGMFAAPSVFVEPQVTQPLVSAQAATPTSGFHWEIILVLIILGIIAALCFLAFLAFMSKGRREEL